MNRWRDWWSQAQRDLEAAEASLKAGFYEWAAFQAQQAAEKALKALVQFRGGQAWGHSLTRLAEELEAPEEVLQACQKLDLLYIPTRYPNGLPEGYPGEFFGESQAKEVISFAEKVIGWVRNSLGGQGQDPEGHQGGR